MNINLLLELVILIFSAIIHEVSHGLVAEQFGDDTAREQGRITLNPIPHIDPYGSILLPLLLIFAGSPIIFGAAKPVPVNFNNMRRPRLGMAMVSLAGPLSNFLLAFIAILPIKLGLTNAVSEPILLLVAYINLILGTFNLIPIPPLDGSKILVSLAPRTWIYRILSFERFGFVLIIVFLLFGWLQKILDPVLYLFGKITGIGF